MVDPAYRAHETLVAPARRTPEIWRLLAGLLLTTAVAVALSRVLQAALLVLLPDLDIASPDFALGNTPISLIVLLTSFGCVTIGVMVAARLVHRRAGLGLIGPVALAVRQFWSVFRLLLVMGVLLLILPPYDMGPDLIPNIDPVLWTLLLPVSLLAVLIQVSAEEILFRGYLQQTLAARFASPLIWIGVPSVLFALGHYLPAEAGENAMLIALWSGVFGVLTADLTARAGTLGPAIAMHLFNNMTALLIVALPDSLSGLALFTLPYSMSDTGPLRAWLAVDFAMMFVSWLVARLAIRR